MSKLLRTSVLAAAMMMVSVSAMTVADAQEKGKKADKAKGTVEVFADAKEQFRFRIKGEDGKTIADSVKGYDTKEKCMTALNDVKEILATTKPVEVKPMKN